MSNTTIEFRETVTPTEAEMFQEWLKSEQNITGLSAKEILHAKKVIVADVNNTVAGFCTIHNPIPGCVILSVLFVHPDFRSKGIGHELLTRQNAAISVGSATVVTSSRNPQVLSWLQEVGYDIRPRIWSLPLMPMFSLMVHACLWYRLRQFLWKKVHGYSLDHFQYAVRRK